MNFFDILLHTDQYLSEASSQLGPWLYLLVFAIVFCETGLVIAPFLPGDSLLFAIGALAAIEESNLSVVWLIIVLAAAAILGDLVNYSIGKFLGPRVFRSDTARLLNKAHLVRAQAFYEKYGGKAIVLARFAPILRTFAPFVAGIGKMNYAAFLAYNVIGGVIWVLLFVGAGYGFGATPFVKRNFQLVILAIIVISLLPVAWEIFASRRAARKGDEGLENQ